MRPASIFERSSTSLMRRSRCLPLTWMSVSGSLMSGGISPYSSSRIISVKPRMAFIGVRSSWLMLARKSDLARLACSSLRLSERNASAACFCSASSRASSRLVSFSRAASAPNSSRFVTRTVPAKWPAATSLRYAEAACTGRMNAHEMTKPPDEGQQDGGHRQRPHRHERAAVGHVDAGPLRSHGLVLLVHDELHLLVDRAVQRVLARELQAQRGVDLAVAHEVGDVGDHRHRLLLAGPDLLDDLALGLGGGLLDADERVVEAVVLSQDIGQGRLVAHEEGHAGQVHLHGQRVLQLVRPRHALVGDVQLVGVLGHAPDVKMRHDEVDLGPGQPRRGRAVRGRSGLSRLCDRPPRSPP